MAANVVYVGLDCGGSSTRILAVDEEGEVLFQGQSGAANLISTPEGRLRRNLRHASEGCPSPKVVCGCFAGLIDHSSRQRALAFLGEIFPIALLRAEPDYMAALFASDGADVCVIAGTGSLVCSFSGEGVVKSGGRGYILGDEGSGFVFGQAAVRHFLRNQGSATPTMTQALLELFGSLHESDIISGIHKAPSPPSALAKLARPLALDAAAGEPYALKALHDGMAALAEVTAKHIQDHAENRPELRIALAGGVWKASGLYRTAFLDALASHLPSVHLDVFRISEAPVHGAVKLARLLLTPA